MKEVILKRPPPRSPKTTSAPQVHQRGTIARATSGRRARVLGSPEMPGDVLSSQLDPDNADAARYCPLISHAHSARSACESLSQAPRVRPQICPSRTDRCTSWNERVGEPLVVVWRNRLRILAVSYTH